MNATLMGAGGFVSQTFLQLAQKEGDGVVALEPGLPVEQMPGGKAFEQAYQARYHTQSSCTRRSPRRHPRAGGGDGKS